MVKLKVLFLLLVLHEALSADNEKKVQIIKRPEVQLSQNDVSVNTQSSKIPPNPHALKNDNPKLIKLTKAGDSVELTKKRLHNRNSRRNIAKKLSWKFPPANCKKIKCPTEKRPVCAKLVHRNTKTNEQMRPFYVIMINECEIKYAACHKGLVTTIVPMKNCHPEFNKTTLIIATAGKRRAKRDIKVDHPTRTPKSNRRAPKNHNKTTSFEKTSVKPSETNSKLPKPLKSSNAKTETNIKPLIKTKLDKTHLKFTNQSKSNEINKISNLKNKTNVQAVNLKMQNKTNLKALGKQKLKSNKTHAKHKNAVFPEANFTSVKKIIVKKSSAKQDKVKSSTDDDVTSRGDILTSKEGPNRTLREKSNGDRQVKTLNAHREGSEATADILNNEEALSNEEMTDQILPDGEPQTEISVETDSESNAGIELANEDPTNDHIDADEATYTPNELTDAENVAFNEVDNGDTKVNQDYQEGVYNSPDYTYVPKPAPIIELSGEHDYDQGDGQNDQGARGDKEHFVDGESEAFGISEDKSKENEDPVILDESEAYPQERNPFGADEEQNKADCPKLCPMRDVMVCAMCQHGIYKTFQSICHVRMFQCANKNEKMELITRYPCVMSAPYITGTPQINTRGRLMEFGDRDRVIQYIRCREKGKLGKDPKCTFPDDMQFSKDIEKPETNETTEY